MWPELKPGPLYLMEIDDAIIAELTEPLWSDMFWCDYIVTPTNADADILLHDPELWNQVRFAVRHVQTQVIVENCFAGGFDPYCERESDRVSFRSLWPTYDHMLNPPGFFFRLLNRFWR